MAFWGINVKPGKPFTHSFDRVRGRLRITQATMGIGSTRKKSFVQCNVGDKSPVFLCALLPDKTESCHLDYEFEEVDDVVFSVIGPRSVYLTGYYVCNGRHSNLNDDTDSYGEDIANTETDESTHYIDEDKYEDSFIDDRDPEVFPHSPVCNGKVLDKDMLDNKKPKDRKGRRKQFKKKYPSAESDNENITQQQNIFNGCRVIQRPESENGDIFPIYSLDKSKTTANNVILKAEAKAHKETSETGNKKTDSGTGAKAEHDGTDVIESQRKADTAVMDGEPERGRKLSYSSTLSCGEVIPENNTEPKEKNKEMSSEWKTHKSNSVNPGHAFNEDNAQQEDSESENISQYLLVRNEQEQKPATVNESDLPCNSLLHPTELGPETCAKTKKKRKEQSEEGKTHKADSGNCSNAFEKGKSQQDEAEADNMDYDLKPATEKTLVPSTEAVSENGTKSKKRRKECSEDGKSLEASGASHGNIFNEDQYKQDAAKVGNRGNDVPTQNEDQKPSNHKSINIAPNHIVVGDQSEEKKIKMKKKKSKSQENQGNMIMDVTLLSAEGNNRSSLEFEDKNVDAKSYQTKTLSNGLIIEELEMGKPDGKMAAPGKKLKVNYVGKLRGNGQIFDSNIGKPPYRFRLGAEEIIEGWNIGVDGMRVGERRRLIIPPSMGYGSEGASGSIPPNSWLVYDVELLGVR